MAKTLKASEKKLVQVKRGLCARSFLRKRPANTSRGTAACRCSRSVSEAIKRRESHHRRGEVA